MNLPADWNVPEIFRRRLGNEAGRQRIMTADGHLLIILHAPPKPDDVHRKGRFFWRKPDGSWESTLGGQTSESLLRHILEFETEIESCDQLENQASDAKSHFEVLRTVTPLKRTVRHMAGVLQDARKACPMDRDLINLRDATVDLERAAELLAEDAKNAMDFSIAYQAESQAKSAHDMSISAHKLNLFAAFFFPIATLCAIFGTNLPSGLENFNPPWPLLGVLLFGIMLGVFLTVFVLRKTK